MNKLYVLMATVLAVLSACIRESKDERIYRQTREYSGKSCPKRMDRYTMLDSMVYIPTGRTMVYFYSMSDRMDADSVYTAQLRDMFDADLLNNIRQNPGLVELKEHAVTFRYVYSSKTTGREYMVFNYTPEKYK